MNCLVWFPARSKPTNSFLYTMTDEHETGAKHVFEVIQGLITEKYILTVLPPFLCIDFNTFIRENKNRYFFPLGVSHTAGCFRLCWGQLSPRRYANENIDQATSRTSTRPRSMETVTFDYFPDVLRKNISGNADIVHVKRIIYWLDLCNLTKASKKRNL